MKPLVVIPARGGSKGVPGKNIKLLGDKPLIQYTIDIAKEVFPSEVICVSTDNHKIKAVVEKLDLSVPFIRPAELATDYSGTNEVLLYAVNYYESKGYIPDTLILLQPTSPFRTAKHLREALNLFDDNCEMVVSVRETKSNPYFILREENDQGWLVKSKKSNFIRRQDCPKVYEINGAIYIVGINVLKEKPMQELYRVRKYLMDEVSSHDIDSMLDWELAERIILGI